VARRSVGYACKKFINVMRKDRLSSGLCSRIMPAVKPEMPFVKRMKGDNVMNNIRTAARRRLPRPAASLLARPRELFGESLPELLLLTAVVAAVVSAVLALNGA
jgi:hypothetical protein